MLSKNIHILARNTLDCAGSILSICWAYPDADISYSIFNNSGSFRSKFNNKNLNKYDTVFAIDLLIKEEDLPLIDKHNVICVEKTPTNTTICKKISVKQTCTITIYRLLRDKIEATPQQKLLVAYIDDYASYIKNLSKSYSYNIICDTIGVAAFVNEFADGDKQLTKEQNALVYNYKSDSLRFINGLSFFNASIRYDNRDVHVVGAFADKFINEVSEYVYKTYPDCEVNFIVNTTKNKVYFRRNKNSNLKLNLLSKILCSGGGLEYASSGIITDQFLDFTKKFTPIDVN